MALQQPMHIQLDVKIPMRDGVRLSACIYRPTAEGRYPTLLIRTIFNNKQDKYVAWTRRFVEAGYAVVMQDCRGRYDSEGAWEPYIHETNDGYDTHQWIGAQPWCDGSIGTFGISYVGFTQTLPAALRSSYLKALVPIASQQDNYGCIYADGALQLHVAMVFHIWIGRGLQSEARALMDETEIYRRLPLVSALDDICDVPWYRDIIGHYTYDDFWKRYGLRNKYEEVDTPSFFITGWYDALVHEGFRQYTGWKTKARSEETRSATRLMVGPWTHGSIGTADRIGDIAFGHGAALDIVQEQIRWYDRRLRGIDNGIDDEPPVHIFVMGDNVWRSEKEWPLARTQFTNYYLHSGGRANSAYGDGELSTEPPREAGQDRYSYDPDDPVTTVGGPIMHVDYGGAQDRRAVERRDDVLVYTSEPLEQDLEVTGPVTMTLYASSSAPDTDFTATLVDVYPNGRAINICEGLRRARFRESIEEPTLIEPGKVYEYAIDLWETANVFKAGHRLRVEVSSSNFPRFDRNLNTGHRPGMDAEMVVAEQTVRHGPEHASHLTLPVIPR